MLEHSSIYPFFFLFLFLITFSISMYIMCVRLFSALSRRVGALQISIIIIIRDLDQVPEDGTVSTDLARPGHPGAPWCFTLMCFTLM